jgi:hypothetical protein
MRDDARFVVLGIGFYTKQQGNDLKYLTRQQQGGTNRNQHKRSSVSRANQMRLLTIGQNVLEWIDV